MTRFRAVALFLSASSLLAQAPTTKSASPKPDPVVSTVRLDSPLPSSGRLGGVAIDRQDNIYVSNFRAEVWRITPTGEVTLFADNINGSSGNAIAPNGDLLQCSFLGGRILRIDAQGAQSVFAEGLKGPVGIVADAQGEVFVCACQDNAIYRISPGGEVKLFVRSPDLSCPNGIALGKGGELFVVSFGNPHVVRITPDGNASRFATLPGQGNAHVAYADEIIYVTQVNTNKMYRIDQSGEFEEYAGSGEVGLEDGPLLEATLAHPNGLAVSADGASLITNNLDGQFRGDKPAKLVLRRISLPAKKPTK